MASGKALVTGATGHIGSALVRALLAAGRPVRALVYGSSDALAGLDVELLHGDVRDAATVRRAVDGCAAVHHLAAQVWLHPWVNPELDSVNVEGARTVAEATRAAGARLVHYSSIHALQPDRTDAVVDESRRYARGPGVPAYDLSKARGSQAVDEAVRRGLDAVMLLPTGVLGPYDLGTSNQGRWLRRAAAGKEPVLVRGGFDWVDVRDVAAAGIAAEDASRAPAGERYLVGGRRAEATELAALAAQAIGRRPPRLVLPLGLAQAIVPAVDAVTSALRLRIPFSGDALHALDTHRAISHDKAARALGHRPRPLDETVRDAMRWYREQGMLLNRRPGITAGLRLRRGGTLTTTEPCPWKHLLFS